MQESETYEVFDQAGDIKVAILEVQDFNFETLKFSDILSMLTSQLCYVIDKKTGKKVPGIVFARGPAVAVLILLESEGKTYTVLTEQVRVPVGRPVLELPAGMLDDIVGTAVREVEEETGIELNLDDMVDLTSFLEPSTGYKVIPSPGGCDEELSLLLYRGSVSADVIKQLQGKETGLREDGELIKVHVVPYETLWRATPDAKVLMSIAIYEMAKKEGLLPHKN
ncbi:hypothetical protein L1987_09755 [Smallanthus sonchifolius]|uniref:Uncharacterized protein n=1 Tax=Smallanthus sonchifolius TaxID=185202 RepID=A0ACB9JQ78_9ASTR|nr:hypothetical protein L1987_09755 [Smallanthus sonchifolius]